MLEGSVEAYALPRLIRALLRTIFIPVGRALGNIYAGLLRRLSRSLHSPSDRAMKSFFARPAGTLLEQECNFRVSAWT